jgi:hypothetical protein
MRATWVQLSKLAIPHVAHRHGGDGPGAVRLLPLPKALPPHRVADSDEGLPTVTFAVYGEGPRRGLEGLLQVTALVFEHVGRSSDEATAVLHRLHALRFAHLAFRSAPWGDDGEDEASFCVVVPLSRPLSPEEHGAAWQALHGDLGGLARPGGAVAGRAWTVPWCPRSPVVPVAYALRDGFVADPGSLLAPRTFADEPMSPPSERRPAPKRPRSRAPRAQPTPRGPR